MRAPIRMAFIFIPILSVASCGGDVDRGTAPVAAGGVDTPTTLMLQGGGIGRCIANYQCDDGNPCTTDVCNPSKGCFHSALPNGTSCVSANRCIAGTSCMAGVCAGGLNVCPNAPYNARAFALDAAAFVMWTDGADLGGPVTQHQVNVYSGGVLVNTLTFGAVQSATITGLTNFVSYTFTITATNADGTSPPSLPTRAVTSWRGLTGLPSAPTIVGLMPGGASIRVFWATGPDGGPPITGTKSPGPHARRPETLATSAWPTSGPGTA